MTEGKPDPARSDPTGGSPGGAEPHGDAESRGDAPSGSAPPRGDAPSGDAREAVRAAFARTPEGPPLRRCPSCGEERATERAFCPACGKRYDRRAAWLSDRARWALAGAALVGVAIAAVAIVPSVVESKRENDAREAAAEARLVAATKRRLAREQRLHRGSARELAPRSGASAAERLAARRALVAALERSILADAQARVAQRELDGPVKRAECDPLIRTPENARDEEDLIKRLGRYDCVAVKSDVINEGKVVATFGHPFVGTADFDRFTYVWCKDNKAPGERGKALAQVPLDRSCVGADPDAPRIGSGYAAPE